MFYVLALAHIYFLNCFVVILCSELETTRHFLGWVWISVKRSIGLYNWKHKICTWIRKSRKVIKRLVVEFFLSVFVISCVTVITREAGSDSNLNGHEGSRPNKINMWIKLIGLENYVLCNNQF